jgi:hypothetical protein
MTYESMPLHDRRRQLNPLDAQRLDQGFGDDAAAHCAAGDMREVAWFIDVHAEPRSMRSANVKRKYAKSEPAGRPDNADRAPSSNAILTDAPRPAATNKQRHKACVAILRCVASTLHVSMGTYGAASCVT